MANSQQSDDILSSTIVARQPIFDKSNQIWGYEVLFRSADGVTPDQIENFDDCIATRSVLSDGLNLIYPSIGPKQRLLINFPAVLLEDRTAKLLPKDKVVVEILETVEPTPEVLEAVAELKSEGYMLAIDDFVGQEELLPFIKYVDLVKVEVQNADAAWLKKTVQGILKIKKVRLLAEKIEDKEMLEECQNAGFTLFQGYYFSRPEIRRGKKIKPSEMARVRLIGMLNNPDFEVSEVSKIISSDAALSIKLFRYLNSSALGLRSRIDSVERGLTILGSERLIQWVTLVVLSQLSSDNLSNQVALNAALNGFFLYDLAKSDKGSLLVEEGVTPGSSFLFGLLMSIKPLLGDSFAEIVKSMPISSEIVEALLDNESVETPYTAWVQLLDGYEHNNLEEIQNFCEDFEIPEQTVNDAYFRSSASVRALFEE